MPCCPVITAGVRSASGFSCRGGSPAGAPIKDRSWHRPHGPMDDADFAKSVGAPGRPSPRVSSGQAAHHDYRYCGSEWRGDQSRSAGFTISLFVLDAFLAAPTRVTRRGGTAFVAREADLERLALDLEGEPHGDDAIDDSDLTLTRDDGREMDGLRRAQQRMKSTLLKSKCCKGVCAVRVCVRACVRACVCVCVCVCVRVGVRARVLHVRVRGWGCTR
jgi:hypothetical protein